MFSRALRAASRHSLELCWGTLLPREIGRAGVSPFHSRKHRDQEDNRPLGSYWAQSCWRKKLGTGLPQWREGPFRLKGNDSL